jgi:hypothetical protein
MSELGESVFGAVNFLNDFFKDVSKLVTTVEESMTGNKLAPLWGGASFWYYSRAYYAPTQWMPRYIVRQYVSEAPDNSKPDKKSPWFAFFNVYFTPKQILEPVAVWGFGTQDEREDLWKSFDKIALNKDGPDFLVGVPVEDWKPIEELPKPLTNFKYQASSVVELNNAQTVDEVVVQPLLREIERLRG